MNYIDKIALPGAPGVSVARTIQEYGSGITAPVAELFVNNEPRMGLVDYRGTAFIALPPDFKNSWVMMTGNSDSSLSAYILLRTKDALREYLYFAEEERVMLIRTIEVHAPVDELLEEMVEATLVRLANLRTMHARAKLAKGIDSPPNEDILSASLDPTILPAKPLRRFHFEIIKAEGCLPQIRLCRTRKNRTEAVEFLRVDAHAPWMTWIDDYGSWAALYLYPEDWGDGFVKWTAECSIRFFERRYLFRLRDGSDDIELVRRWLDKREEDHSLEAYREMLYQYSNELFDLIRDAYKLGLLGCG